MLQQAAAMLHHVQGPAMLQDAAMHQQTAHDHLARQQHVPNMLAPSTTHSMTIDGHCWLQGHCWLHCPCHPWHLLHVPVLAVVAVLAQPAWGSPSVLS